MRYLTVAEVIELHRVMVERTGGVGGIRDAGALESAIAQPKSSFGGVDLHASLVEKAASLCFSLVQNHPFLDGNKRVGHAAMETFLILNGLEIEAPVDEQERLMLSIAGGSMSRSDLESWLRNHTKPTNPVAG